MTMVVVIAMIPMVLSTPTTEVWYDGVDQNCDGLGDNDQDGDGEDSGVYGGVIAMIQIALSTPEQQRFGTMEWTKIVMD